GTCNGTQSYYAIQVQFNIGEDDPVRCLLSWSWGDGR
ncbi:unnamed protein product, partial [Allacma fusca]